MIKNNWDKNELEKRGDLTATGVKITLEGIKFWDFKNAEKIFFYMKVDVFWRDFYIKRID